MRAKVRSRVGWAWVAAAAAIAGVSALLARLWLAAPVAGVLGAVVAVVAGAWMTHGVAAVEARASWRRALTGGAWRGRHGRLPRVRDVADPVAMGVHPAAWLAGSADDRVPPFVGREFCAQLRAALVRDRFVLLVGESTAGKTRAAFELVQAELQGYRVVVPSGRDTAVISAELAAGTSRCVLWLDDLERFLGSGGLTGSVIRQVLAGGPGPRYVVATMRSEEYARLSGRTATGSEGISGEVLRQSWDVVRQARRIEVPRLWSAQELALAGQVKDRRLADAVRHADEFGVAEYLAAGPQLLADWRDAWSPGTHPRAAAMILAAVDARRAGVHRPLPESVLVRLHEPYLERRGGDRLRPEPVESALAWAVTPLHATSSLLLPGGGGFLAFDYLIDAADKDRVPADAVDVLVSFATPGEAIDIARLAWDWSLFDQADAGFRRAEADGLFDATSWRSYLIEERHGTAAALTYAREAAEWITATAAPGDSRIVDAHALVAWHTGHGGDSVTARRMLEDLASQSGQAVGSDHQQTLKLRRGIAAMAGAAGNYLDAARLEEDLARDCGRVLGDDHQMTLECRDQHAMWLRQAGQHRRSVELLSELVGDMKRFGSPLRDLSHTEQQLAWSLQSAGQHDMALQQWRHIVEETQDAYGLLHATTLYVRHEHAWCAGEAGNPAGAADLLEHLLADAATLQCPASHLSRDIRRSLAWWTGEAGDTSNAVQQLTQLNKEYEAQRGNTDPRVKSLRYMLVLWEALNGNPQKNLDIIRRTVAEMTSHLGADHPIARAAQRQITKFGNC